MADIQIKDRIIKKLEKTGNWIKDDTGYAIFISSTVVIFWTAILTSFRDIQITSITAAISILTTSAQVCATFAGFLIVGLIFLIDKRNRFLLDLKLNPVDFSKYDVVLYFVALIILAYLALDISIHLGTLQMDPQNSAKIAGYVSSVVAGLKVALLSLALGFGYSIGFYRGIQTSLKEKSQEKV